MLSFEKNLRLQEKTRRYSIVTTPSGWEVREEQNSEVVKRVHYHDWHRVERARRSISIELDSLRQQGWSEVKKSDLTNSSCRPR